MASRRMIVYGGSSLRSHLSATDLGQMQQYPHLFAPVLAWLEARSKQLQADEDMVGSFKEDCPTHLHVRAMKGARIDCDDIHGELKSIVFPQT